MKKVVGKILVTVSAVLLALLLFTLASCEKERQTGVITVVVGDDEYEVDLDKVEQGDGLIPVLDYLKDTEGLSYEANDMGYGAYLTTVGDLKEDALNGKYLFVWTSVEADYDVSTFATTKEYKGKTLTSSGVSVSEMTLEDGAIIYIGYYE